MTCPLSITIAATGLLINAAATAVLQTMTPDPVTGLCNRRFFVPGLSEIAGHDIVDLSMADEVLISSIVLAVTIASKQAD
jgi:hypothetical protein